ncbi:unnamed protein product [Aphanomyces euteiches]
MRPRAAFWTTRLTVQHIRNGLTVFALVYVIIRGLSSSSSPLAIAQGPPPPLSPQDTAFVAQCRSYYEASALRRNRCDDPPAQLCQNICLGLAANLTYYASLWPTTLLPACDATCAVHQGSICNNGVSYLQLCEAAARARAQAAAPDQVHVMVQDDRASPSFFSLLVLIFVAASDILVSLAEYKAKYLVAPQDEAALYDASQLDVTAALISQALKAAEQPEHLLTVAKTSFEIRCLLFDNSCDQALQLIVLFQVVSFLWHYRSRATRFLPANLRFDKDDPTSPTSAGETEGQFEETPPPARTSSGSQEFSKAQSMAAFTQGSALGSRTGSHETQVQPPEPAAAVAPVAASPVTSPVAQTAAAPSPFGKLTRLMGK